MLKKRVEVLEEQESRRDRQLLDNARKICCNGTKYCLECGAYTTKFHKKYLSLYKRFLKEGRQGKFFDRPSDEIAIKAMEKAIQQFETSGITYKYQGEAAYESLANAEWTDSP